MKYNRVKGHYDQKDIVFLKKVRKVDFIIHAERKEKLLNCKKIEKNTK